MTGSGVTHKYLLCQTKWRVWGGTQGIVVPDSTTSDRVAHKQLFDTLAHKQLLVPGSTAGDRQAHKQLLVPGSTVVDRLVHKQLLVPGSTVGDRLVHKQLLVPDKQ